MCTCPNKDTCLRELYRYHELSGKTSHFVHILIMNAKNVHTESQNICDKLCLLHNNVPYAVICYVRISSVHVYYPKQVTDTCISLGSMTNLVGYTSTLLRFHCYHFLYQFHWTGSTYLLPHTRSIVISYPSLPPKHNHEIWQRHHNIMSDGKRDSYRSFRWIGSTSTCCIESDSIYLLTGFEHSPG